MKKLQLEDSKEKLAKYTRLAVRKLNKAKVVIISLLALVFLGFTIQEAAQVSKQSIDSNELQLKQLEIQTKKITFDEELINIILKRAGQPIDIKPDNRRSTNPLGGS